MSESCATNGAVAVPKFDSVSPGWIVNMGGVKVPREVVTVMGKVTYGAGLAVSLYSNECPSVILVLLLPDGCRLKSRSILIAGISSSFTVTEAVACPVIGV